MNDAIGVAIASACGAVGGAAMTWLGTRTTASAAVTTAQAGQPAAMMAALSAFQNAVSEAAEGMIGELRAEVQRLQTRIAALEDENEICRGENRQMAQRQESLEQILRRAGLDIRAAAPPNALMVAEGGQVTTFATERTAP